MKLKVTVNGVAYDVDVDVDKTQNNAMGTILFGGGAGGPVGVVVEVVEDGVVARPRQVGPGACGHDPWGLAELAGVGAQEVDGDDDVLARHRGVEALIAEHGIRYLAQLPYTGEPVPVRARVEKVSAASVRIGYSILSPVDQRECVRAFTVLAFWDSVAGRLTRLSPEQRELLSSFLPKE